MQGNAVKNARFAALDFMITITCKLIMTVPAPRLVWNAANALNADMKAGLPELAASWNMVIALIDIKTTMGSSRYC